MKSLLAKRTRIYSSESEILHYNVMVYKTEECELNGYTFTSLPEALTFYTENRLNKQFLSMPV